MWGNRPQSWNFDFNFHFVSPTKYVVSLTFPVLDVFVSDLMI